MSYYFLEGDEEFVLETYLSDDEIEVDEDQENNEISTTKVSIFAWYYQLYKYTRLLKVEQWIETILVYVRYGVLKKLSKTLLNEDIR